MTSYSLDSLIESKRVPLGTSSWVPVTQPRIDNFAEASEDWQWIHTDPDRAEAGPYGATIAPGYLTLALLGTLLGEVLEVTDADIVINYGANKVRFLTPVLVGSRIRGRGELLEVVELPNGVQATIRMTAEVENAEKPACVAEILIRYLTDVTSKKCDETVLI